MLGGTPGSEGHLARRDGVALGNELQYLLWEPITSGGVLVAAHRIDVGATIAFAVGLALSLDSMIRIN